MANLQETWSTTAATNASADSSVPLASGTLFASDHGAGRSLLARVAAFSKSLNGCITTGGSANAQTFTSPSGHAYTALAQGMRIGFIAGFSNSGAATLAVDGLTAKAIRKNGVTALASGDIVAGNFYEVMYDAVNGWWQLVGYRADLSGYQPLDATLTAFAALTWTSGNQFPYLTAADTLSLGTITANGLTLLGHTFAQMLSDLGAASDSLAAHLAGTETFTGKKTMSGADFVLDVGGPTSTLSAGYRGAPAVGTPNSAYTMVLADAGGTLYHDEVTARTWTIPANASVAFPIGTVIILDNTGNSGSAGVLTISITSDTLRRGDGTAGTGSRTIAASGICAIRKTKSTEWSITGTGLS